MPAGPPPYRPPYRWALAMGGAILLLYIVTLAPTTAFWDTSEYIATAHILGIPHPPGNPVFVFLAHTWELLLAWAPVTTAVKINLFSAVNGAAAAALWFLVAHRVLATFDENETFRLLGATAAALLSATAFTVWNQSNVNEKVYTISLMTIALLTWLIFRWRDNLGSEKDHNLLVFIIFVLALSVGNHLMAFLAAPALAVYVLVVQPAVLKRWRLYAFAALAFALGLSAQMFLPIRAADDPIINEADPVCESLADAAVDVLTFGRADACPALASSLRREQYRKPPLNLNPIFYPRERPRDFHLLGWQFVHYFQYFDWQWARGLMGSEHFLAGARLPVTLLFLFLGAFGAWRHYQRDRESWAYFATLFVTVSIGLVIYLNFKYGYSVPAEPPPGAAQAGLAWREVRERDYFFIVSFSHWGVWAGIGLAALWQVLSRRLTDAATLRRPDYLRAAPVLLLAALPLLLNWRHASRADNYAARDWAYNILMSIEPYGVLFTNGDNDTFPLWYLQEVEGLRQDVTVIVYSYLATPWYAQQLRDLTRPCEGRDPAERPTQITCQRPFEPDEAIPIYRDRDWQPPARSILDMTDDEIASVPDCYPSQFGRCAGFPDSVTVPIGNVAGLIPRGAGLIRNDLLVLRIMQNSAGDRPIYFAGTTGTYEQFTLQPYLIRQGVAYKLANEQVQPGDSILALPQEFGGARDLPSLVNAPRTRELLEDHYIYRDLTDWDFWPDYSTSGIPLQYYQAYISMTGIYLLQGQADRADEMYGRAMDFVSLALGRVEREELPEAAEPGELPSPDEAMPGEAVPDGGTETTAPGAETADTGGR